MFDGFGTAFELLLGMVAVTVIAAVILGSAAVYFAVTGGEAKEICVYANAKGYDMGPYCKEEE